MDEATTAVTEVIEVVEQIDYTGFFQQLYMSSQNIEYAVQMIAGFCLFAVIVTLCYFCYRFFKIFF